MRLPESARLEDEIVVATRAFALWLARQGEHILELDDDTLEVRWSQFRAFQRGDDGES